MNDTQLIENGATVNDGGSLHSIPFDKSRDTIIIDESASVVSNDTQAAVVAISLQDATTFTHYFEFMENVRKTRIDWESNLYRTSTTALYEILRECYRVVVHPEVNNPDSAVRKAIESLCKTRMAKVLKNTKIEAKVIRIVFENLKNRRRVSSYSIVLQEAKRTNVSVEKFADWIRDAGGIEEIRLNPKPAPIRKSKPAHNSSKPKSKKADKEAARQAEIAARTETLTQLEESGFISYGTKAAEPAAELPDQPEVPTTAVEIDSSMLGTTSNDSSTARGAANDDAIECVCIAYKRSDGGYEIRGELKNEELVSRAIAAFYSEREVLTEDSVHSA